MSLLWSKQYFNSEPFNRTWYNLLWIQVCKPSAIVCRNDGSFGAHYVSVSPAMYYVYPTMPVSLSCFPLHKI